MGGTENDSNSNPVSDVDDCDRVLTTTTIVAADSKPVMKYPSDTLLPVMKYPSDTSLPLTQEASAVKDTTITDAITSKKEGEKEFKFKVTDLVKATLIETKKEKVFHPIKVLDQPVDSFEVVFNSKKVAANEKDIDLFSGFHFTYRLKSLKKLLLRARKMVAFQNQIAADKSLDIQGLSIQLLSSDDDKEVVSVNLQLNSGAIEYMWRVYLGHLQHSLDHLRWKRGKLSKIKVHLHLVPSLYGSYLNDSIFRKDEYTADKLLELGWDPLVINPFMNQNTSAIHFAAQQGMGSMIMKLVDQYKVPLDIQDGNKHTILFWFDSGPNNREELLKHSEFMEWFYRKLYAGVECTNFWFIDVEQKIAPEWWSSQIALSFMKEIKQLAVGQSVVLQYLSPPDSTTRYGGFTVSRFYKDVEGKTYYELVAPGHQSATVLRTQLEPIWPFLSDVPTISETEKKNKDVNTRLLFVALLLIGIVCSAATTIMFPPKQAVAPQISHCVIFQNNCQNNVNASYVTLYGTISSEANCTQLARSLHKGCDNDDFGNDFTTAIYYLDKGQNLSFSTFPQMKPAPFNWTAELMKVMPMHYNDGEISTTFYHTFAAAFERARILKVRYLSAATFTSLGMTQMQAENLSRHLERLYA